MFCFVGNVTLAVRMGSVIRVTKMEFITISAILCLTFMTTTKSFRNTGKQRLSTSPDFLKNWLTSLCFVCEEFQPPIKKKRNIIEYE